MHHADTNQKKAEGALVISYKMNFRTKNIVSDKYDHFKIKKGSMNQENITILKDYAHNNKASKYIEIKNDITERRKVGFTFIAKGFNTFLSIVIWEECSRQKKRSGRVCVLKECKAVCCVWTRASWGNVVHGRPVLDCTRSCGPWSWGCQNTKQIREKKVFAS